MRVSDDFFKINASELAPKMLGKIICRKFEDGSVRRARIVETECYLGADDSASHGYRGKTPRNKIMFEEGGVAYVYLCYGIHFLFNIVSGEKGSPQGVLIRGVEGAIGPGRVTRYLGIDKSFYGENLKTSKVLWLEDDGACPKIKFAKRVGIGYAKEEDQNKLWRFLAEFKK